MGQKHYEYLMGSKCKIFLASSVQHYEYLMGSKCKILLVSSVQHNEYYMGSKCKIFLDVLKKNIKCFAIFTSRTCPSLGKTVHFKIITRAKCENLAHETLLIH